MNNYHIKGLYKTTSYKIKSNFSQFFFFHWWLHNYFFSFLIKAFANFEKLIRFHWQAFVVNKNGENLKMLIEIFCQKLTVSNVILAFFDILKPNIFFVDQLWWPTYSANPFQNLWIRSWIMKSHFKLYKTYAFPKVHLHRCQRSCKIEYLDSGLVYSKKGYTVYYINCTLFSRALGTFVNTGYEGWNNIHEKQKLYIGSKYQNDATKGASGIITKFAEPNNTIPYQTNDTLNVRQKTYSKIV